MDSPNMNDQGDPMAQAPQSAVATPVQPVPIASSPQMPAAASATQAGQTNGPTEAADVDVIETEWILKAKQIVNATREDPFMQVQQLNQLKADYMQKRYNKTVKLPDA